MNTSDFDPPLWTPRAGPEIFGLPCGPPIFGFPAPIAATVATRRAVPDEDARWFGSTAAAEAVRRWRLFYGDDARAPLTLKRERAWERRNPSWCAAADAARRVLRDIPAKSEQYRVRLSLGGLQKPSLAIGNAALRGHIIEFMRLPPGKEPALYMAGLLAEDKWTPFHVLARTYLKRLGADARPGEVWTPCWVDALIKEARYTRTVDRGGPWHWAYCP